MRAYPRHAFNRIFVCKDVKGDFKLYRVPRWSPGDFTGHQWAPVGDNGTYIYI